MPTSRYEQSVFVNCPFDADYAQLFGRELQMIAHPPSRATLEKRPAFWVFKRLDTFRRRILQRAGRLIRPQRQITVSMPANPAVQEELLQYLEALQAA